MFQYVQLRVLNPEIGHQSGGLHVSCDELEIYTRFFPPSVTQRSEKRKAVAWSMWLNKINLRELMKSSASQPFFRLLLSAFSSKVGLSGTDITYDTALNESTFSDEQSWSVMLQIFEEYNHDVWIYTRSADLQFNIIGISQ